MNDSLGDRMKRYEIPCRARLVPRMPIVIRVDGRAFHTLTAGLQAFDESFASAMDFTANTLFGDAMGCVLAYTQSDEISLLLHPYQTYASEPWFGGQVQKIVSVSAGVASAAFSTMFGKMAAFDARVFNIPEADVPNYFVWRQKDCIRNSVQSLARTVFSHKECHGKSCEQLKYMLSTAASSWDALDDYWTLGRTIQKGVYNPNQPRMPGVIAFKYDSPLFRRILAVEDESREARAMMPTIPEGATA